MDFSRIGQPVTVAQLVTVDVFDAEGGSVEGSAELRFDPSDPFAVTMTFLTEDPAVSWVFGRDLLIDGMHRPTGDGDVHVRPFLDRDGHAVVVMEFRSGDEVGLVQVRTVSIRSFVDQVTASVPRGSESAYLDVEALRALLVAEGE